MPSSARSRRSASARGTMCEASSWSCSPRPSSVWLALAPWCASVGLALSTATPSSITNCGASGARGAAAWSVSGPSRAARCAALALRAAAVAPSSCCVHVSSKSRCASRTLTARRSWRAVSFGSLDFLFAAPAVACDGAPFVSVAQSGGYVAVTGRFLA